MIYQRAVAREFSTTAAGVFVALFAILITTQLIRLLNQAAGGKLAPEAVAALLGFGALNYLPVVLSLTLFLSVLTSLTRMYRDSEMVVWFSSGLSLLAWVRPVTRFAMPLVLAIAVLSVFLSPWALSRSAEYRNRMNDREEVTNLAPGVFRESKGADRVFFVESMAEDGAHVRNIFVSSRQHGRLGVMVAEEGYTETRANGDRFLVLLNGRRYEGNPGTPEYGVMQFDRYAVRVELKSQPIQDGSPKLLPVWELAANPTPANLGEIIWRLGLPLSALTLALLAVPLSFVGPRAGRTSNLVVAILVYMIYSNFISVSQAWVQQGKLAFELGFVGVHLAMLLAAGLLYYRRMSLTWLPTRK